MSKADGGVRRAEFDSDVFGLDVGRATVRSQDDVLALSQGLAGFDAVWVTVSEMSLVAPVCNLATVGAVGYRYEFLKLAAGRGEDWPSELQAIEDPSDIEELTQQTFLSTRFYTDARTAPRADRLYRAWVCNGINEGRVRGFTEGSRFVGFILWGRDADGVGRHVLAAVHPECRAKGLYSRMITASERALPAGTPAKGKVPVENVAPVRALLSLGYRIQELEAVVHLWR